MPSPVDVQIWWGTNPPAIKPVSARAKRMISMPEGVDAVILLESAEVAMDAMPKDFIIETTTDIPKTVSILEKLSVLH